MSWLPVLAIVGAAADVPATEPHDRVRGDVSGYYFLLPHEADAALGIGTVELGRTHLEGRYGYEGPRTGSIFLGQRVDLLDSTLQLAVTPMLGGVFGRTTGVAPALEIEAKLGKLELSSESEVVFDLRETGFFYSWSELVVRPLKPVVVGGALERTRIFQQSATWDPGVVVAATVARFTARAYAFVPWSAERFYVFALQGDL